MDPVEKRKLCFSATADLVKAIVTDRNCEDRPFGCAPGFLYGGLEAQPVWHKGIKLRPDTNLVYGFYVLPPKAALFPSKPQAAAKQ